MSQAILSYEDFIGRVGEFAKQAPTLLGRHASTADLASRVDGVAEQGEKPFTVAVVGQMRVGKSTLLNALMERDLAITGVNETTATLNWFRHGSREQEGFFRVIWKDLPAEDFRFELIGEWVGDSQKAARTAAIEFFVDSPYLRIANLVDTPGSRSAIGSHEETINRFLSGKLEEETNKQAQRADAIIYVFGAVGHENDETLLQQFESSTRIQGSSPFNSVAVLHKWDSLNVADPRKDARRKAAVLLERMSSHVSDVIPVSAPLFQAVTKFDDRFWESVSRMANETDEDDMEDLLMGPVEFVEDAASCPLDVSERKALRTTYQLPWETLTLLFKICACDGCKTGAELRQSALKSSGIPELRSFLDLRFFNRSRAIKSFSLLALSLIHI